MISSTPADRKWNERSSAPLMPALDNQGMFQLLFERSVDAIWLLDPNALVFVDCNQAAVELLRARDKAQLLGATPGDLSPACQPDGKESLAKAAELTALVEREGTQRFEWVARRFDGSEVPLEVMATPITAQGRRLNVIISRDISERKAAEKEILELNQTLERRILERTAELAAREAQLRTLIEHAPDAIVVFSAETGQFTVCNENATRLYGLPREQLLKMTSGQASPEFQPDGRRSGKVAREKINEAIAGGTPIFEWMHRHADGRLIPCEVRLVRLPGEGPPLIRASIIDNTERKRRERTQEATFAISEAVHAAEDLESLYRRIHEIILGLMPAQNFYIALLDAPSEMISFAYHVDERSPKPGPRRMNIGLTSVVLRTAKPLLVTQEMDIRKHGSGEVSCEGLESVPYVECGDPAAVWLGVPLLFQGKALGVLAVQDYHNERAYGEQEKQILTFVAGQIAVAIERKRIEQARRDSEEKFRALFEASSQGVILHDEEKMMEVNPACLRILGFQGPEEMIGKHPAETSAPIQLNGESADVLARQYIDECMHLGSARFEWLARNSRGQEIPIEIVLTRIQAGGQQLIQAVFNDISERKKAEADLLRNLAREKELNQLKSSFVSMVSHEFRTPLGIIQSSAEILQDYFPRLEAAERDDQLRSIIKNTRRMAEMMEEVLVLSRIDAGRMDFKPTPLDVGAFCRRIVEEVLSATEDRCPIELSLGAVPPAFAFPGDERLLGYIFTNLLGNAVKYSERGAAVCFAVELMESEIIWQVTDTGIGIPEKDQEWLFTAFQRGGNVGDRPGTGLGLVLVKRCVELHGGNVCIDSRIGCGTTVTVRLPIGADFNL